MKGMNVALAVGLLAGPSVGTWSPAVKLRELTVSITPGFAGPRLATSATGEAVATWSEGLGVFHALGQQMVSILRPGLDWTPASPFSDQPGPIESPVVAMAADGTIITMWVERPGNQTLLMTRRFVPAEGWEPIQTLLELTNSGSIEPVPPFIPALAISPDGMGHLVFFNEGNMVAMTLAPGRSEWSAPIVINQGYARATRLVAGNRHAFAAFDMEFSGIRLAVYDDGGWHSATQLSTPGVVAASLSEMAYNSGQAIVSWTETTDFSNPANLWVQRLTGQTEKFLAPSEFCKVGIFQNATVLAACAVTGDPVPGCFQSTRVGNFQQYTRYLQAYQRPPSAEWSAPEVVSDTGKRVFDDQYTRVLVNGKGFAFLLWDADIPCHDRSQEVYSREWSPILSFWQVEEALTSSNTNLLMDAQLDRRGSVRVLLNELEPGPIPSESYISRLWAREMYLDYSVPTPPNL